MDSPSKIRTSAKVCLLNSVVVRQYEGDAPHKATRPSRKSVNSSGVGHSNAVQGTIQIDVLAIQGLAAIFR